MDDVTKNALLSMLRSILLVIGGILVAKGLASQDLINEFVGSATIALPAIWGVVDKYLTERAAKAREAIAVSAGMHALSNPGIPADTVSHVVATEIIEDYKQSKGEVK